MLKTELSGKRKRRRPKRRLKDAVREDMAVVEVTGVREVMAVVK